MKSRPTQARPFEFLLDWEFLSKFFFPHSFCLKKQQHDISTLGGLPRIWVSEEDFKINPKAAISGTLGEVKKSLMGAGWVEGGNLPGLKKLQMA